MCRRCRGQTPRLSTHADLRAVDTGFPLELVSISCLGGRRIEALSTMHAVRARRLWRFAWRGTFRASRRAVSALKNHSVVAIYDSHTAAEAAVKALQQAGLDMTRLSIVDKGFHTEEHAVGFYTSRKRERRHGRACTRCPQANRRFGAHRTHRIMQLAALQR